MKIMKMFRWYWQNTYWALVGFYGAMLGVLLLGSTIAICAGESEVSVNGFSFSSAVMIFVMGIVFFSAGTRFGPSNGASRKSTFCGFLLFLVTLSAGKMLINMILSQMGQWFGVHTQELEALLYPGTSGFGGWLSIFLCQTAAGLATGILGYFIGGAYYRMSKIWKIVVSIAVPALVVIGLPLFFVSFPSVAEGIVVKLLAPLGNWVLRSPYCLALLFLGTAALLGLFSWLLIRRAPVKAAG